MATEKGVIQGYCGVAAVDGKHQIIIEAQAHGTGSEQALLMPVIDATAHLRTDDTLITADAGYHSKDNVAELAARKIPALIADNGMRGRDERFKNRIRYKAKPDPLHNKQGKRARPAVEALLAQTALPVSITEEPTLGEGQVYLRLGPAETHVDLDRATALISQAVRGFFGLSEQEHP